MDSNDGEWFPKSKSAKPQHTPNQKRMIANQQAFSVRPTGDGLSTPLEYQLAGGTKYWEQRTGNKRVTKVTGAKRMPPGARLDAKANPEGPSDLSKYPYESTKRTKLGSLPSKVQSQAQAHRVASVFGMEAGGEKRNVDTVSTGHNHKHSDFEKAATKRLKEGDLIDVEVETEHAPLGSASQELARIESQRVATRKRVEGWYNAYKEKHPNQERVSGDKRRVIYANGDTFERDIGEDEVFPFASHLVNPDAAAARKRSRALLLNDDSDDMRSSGDEDGYFSDLEGQNLTKIGQYTKRKMTPDEKKRLAKMNIKTPKSR